jgi:nitrite reductase/ring-hydroxylating ferredoxin subunit
MPWVHATSIEKLKLQPQVIRVPPRQVAVFLVNDQPFAIDNGCSFLPAPCFQGESCFSG